MEALNQSERAGGGSAVLPEDPSAAHLAVRRMQPMTF